MSYIKDAVHQKNPTIVGFVSEVGEISSNTNNAGEEYSRQTVILTDNSADIKVILWNDECGQLGYKAYYKLENIWVKEYEGKPQIHIGKFGKITPVTVDEMLPIQSETLDMNADNIVPSDPLSGPVMSGEVSFPISPDPLDIEIESATKAMKAFIKACKEEGAEGATLNAASVFNTVLMRRGK